MSASPRPSAADSFVFAAILIAVVAGSSGCTDREPVTVGTADPQLEVKPFGTGGTKLYSSMLEINGTETTRGYALGDGEWELQFIPVARRGGVRVEVFAQSEGRAQRLGDVDAINGLNTPNAGEAGLADAERFAAFATPIRFDLTQYAGREVSIRWVVHDGSESESGHEGDPEKVLHVAIRRFAIKRKARPGPRRPHVLFVCSDTHRVDYALEGRGPELMPRLQELADESVVYRRAVSSASWTLPSIVSVMTGLDPRYHLTGRRVAMGLLEDLDEAAIEPGQFYIPWMKYYRMMTAYPRQLRTLSEVLRDAGYTTVMILANPHYFASGLFKDGAELAIDTEVGDGDKLNDLASRVMDAVGNERPLFLLVHMMDVHQYIYWYFHRDRPGAHPWNASPDDVRAAYEKAVRDSDRYLGELLDMWDAKMGREDSMVVFFSDHGEHLFDPGSSPGDPIPERNRRELENALPTLHHGNSIQEALLRVPLVVRYPSAAGVEPGVVDATVGLIDIMPTVLELLEINASEVGVAGLAGSAGLSGRSLIGAGARRGEPSDGGSIGGGDGVGDRGGGERVFFADYQLYADELSSVRRGNLKLVINETLGTSELIDTTKPYLPGGEPGQAIEAAEAKAELEAAFAAYAAAAVAATENLSSDETLGDTEALLKTLESVGYLK